MAYSFMVRPKSRYHDIINQQAARELLDKEYNFIDNQSRREFVRRACVEGKLSVKRIAEISNLSPHYIQTIWDEAHA